MVKNALANAGDMGSIPNPGRSYMSQSNSTCAPQLQRGFCMYGVLLFGWLGLGYFD